MIARRFATSDSHPPFEILEHTADAGIVAHGHDLAALFVNAAAGMSSLMVDIGGLEEREVRDIAVRAHDRESLMVRWLTELLYYLDSEQMLFRRFEVTAIDDTRLNVRAFGERIDRSRHNLHFGVKAVTRHMLEIVRQDGYRATILFDI